MNKTVSAVIAATILAATSFSTFAATQVDQNQALDMQSIGSVSVSGVRGTLDDATHKLAQKAEALGASHYRIVRADTPGDSSLWSGTAEIYR